MFFSLLYLYFQQNDKNYPGSNVGHFISVVWSGITEVGAAIYYCPSDRWTYLASESEKPRQRVSNADRKVFANPESFPTSSLLAKEFLDNLENVQILYKYPDNMQSVQMNWKVSR